MAKDPLERYGQQTGPQDTEFGWGRGNYPDPNIDYSGNGSISRIPIADPDGREQLRNLAAARRSDLNDPSAPFPASPYDAGNTDRFGAGPPLVVERRAPKAPRKPQETRRKMQREW